uniref:Interleukin-11 receptor subunit alpha n=1 Tax=Anser brachyrhynchus TaxID=132585 RepID=A0A8B9I7B0_9AVES
MHSPTRGLGRVMVFLAAALASASLAVPEGWGEEGEPPPGPPVAARHSPPSMRTLGSPVQWRREGAAALPEGSAIHQGALVLPHASLAAAGTYSCHGEDGDPSLTIASLRAPDLPGVPFVSCRASDYENFSCSWTSKQGMGFEGEPWDPSQGKPQLLGSPGQLVPCTIQKLAPWWEVELQGGKAAPTSCCPMAGCSLGTVPHGPQGKVELPGAPQGHPWAPRPPSHCETPRAPFFTPPSATASEGTTTDASLESLAEEPSQAPNPEPINRSDPLEKMAILVSLGIFAFFVLAAVLIITILIWLRVRKHSKDETKPHNFLVAATHLKTLLRTQILP